MTAHIITNYEQVKARLSELTHSFDRASREYLFAVGDLFNENVPPAPASPEYAGHANGREVRAYTREVGREIDRLLREAGAPISKSHLQHVRYTARHWPKDKRVADCAWSTYRILASHPDRFALIRDGMSGGEAAALVGRAAPQRRHRPGQTLRLRISANDLRDTLSRDDESPLTEEQKAIVGEIYAMLDDYCEAKGIDMSEPPLVLAA